MKNELTELNKKLIDSAKIGDVKEVKKLLEAGADVRAYDEALRKAFFKGHTETVKVLIEAGADVHSLGNDAIYWAAKGGRTEIVKLLIEEGADVHAEGGYALMQAARNGHTEIVKLLIEVGVNVNAGDDHPLQLAALNGHTETVRLLIAKGANVCARDDLALRWAVRKGYAETVKVLEEAGASIKTIQEDMINRALKIACEAHYGQIDKCGKSYILHCIEVMNLLKTDCEYLKTIAILHDVIEDSNITLLDLEVQGFPGDVLKSVDLLTKKKDQSNQEYLDAICSDKYAMLVKLADLEHNSKISRQPANLDQKDFDRLAKYFKMYQHINIGLKKLTTTKKQ